MNEIFSECWDRAIYAHGTAQIFIRRSNKLKRRLRWLSFFGLAGVVCIGAIVTLFGIGAPSLSWVLAIAGIVAVGQLLLSLWSLIANWADNLAYSLESAAENLALSSAFRELGKRAQNPPPDLDARFADLRARDESRRISDTKQGITEKEKRFGMRAGLFQFQRECAGCNKVPASMEPTACKVCGGF
jgi:mobilome CxxCx(11)CxxC protein